MALMGSQEEIKWPEHGSLNYGQINKLGSHIVTVRDTLRVKMVIGYFLLRVMR